MSLILLLTILKALFSLTINIKTKLQDLNFKFVKNLNYSFNLYPVSEILRVDNFYIYHM